CNVQTAGEDDHERQVRGAAGGTPRRAVDARGTDQRGAHAFPRVTQPSRVPTAPRLTYDGPMIPRLSAIVTACVRSLADNFARMLRTCVCTVSSELPSLSA